MSDDEAPPPYYTPPRRAGVRPIWTRRIDPLVYNAIQEILAEQRELWETRGTPPEYEESAVPSVLPDASHDARQGQETHAQSMRYQDVEQATPDDLQVRPPGPPPRYCHPAVRLAREARVAEEWRQRDLERRNEPQLRDDDLVARSTAYSRCTRWRIQPGFRYAAAASNAEISWEGVEPFIHHSATSVAPLPPATVLSGDGSRDDRVAQDQPVWDLRVAELSRRRKKTGSLARLLATVNVMAEDYECILDGKAPQEEVQRDAKAEPYSRIVYLWHGMLIRRKGRRQ
ncbi:hypothetical protein LTR27_008424 [Elasticomyces elasticus]|nr:hypothetical protein LTR27_008424 [Elasticomyces elasticus]